MNKPRILILLVMSIFSFGCRSQENNDKPGKGDRQAAVAGQFYEADPVALYKDLSVLFAKARPCEHTQVAAIVSPHAGYVYSGNVAASAFNQLDPDHRYKTIFIIGSSHRMAFNGAAVYCAGDFITPLGRVITDTATGKKLVKQHPVFTQSTEPHLKEHCLEVQLPFLQFHLKKEFTIVPILIGTDDPDEIKNIADALRPYFNDENLFVISTDLSHYPTYANASKADRLTIDAILSNSSEKLLSVLQSNQKLSIPNLATSLCSWTSVLTLLYLTEKNKDLDVREIEYKNSGDAGIGDSSRVVGYAAITFNRKQQNDQGFALQGQDKKDLLDIARKTITTYVTDRKLPAVDTTRYSDIIKQHCGAFVTLKTGDKLRGCIGRFTSDKPLYLVVRDMAIAAATQDPRFTPVRTEELSSISIEISVLSPLKKIATVDEITMGRHGIYIVKGASTGTFLPQVATETGWTKDEFLGHCAQDKAGIGWYGWKDADIYIYTADVFHEE